MDEERVRDSLRRVADEAPEPSDLRSAVQRRVVSRRRRLVALSVAVASIAGFATAVAIDAIDDDSRVEVVPASTGAPSSHTDGTTSSTRGAAVTVVTDGSSSTSSPSPPTVSNGSIDNASGETIVATISMPRCLGTSLAGSATRSSHRRCDPTGFDSTLVAILPSGDSVLLPRSPVGEISWVVVDAPRERIFFGVSSGCDPGDNGTWVIGFDGATPRQLNHEGSRVAVSPDGRFIAQTVHTDGCGSRQLRVQEIASDAMFTYTAAESLGTVAWAEDDSALLVGVDDADARVLRFPVSQSGAIADPVPVDSLQTYRILDSSGDRALLGRECPPNANCSVRTLHTAIARDGVIEREVACPEVGCDAAGEPRLGPHGTIAWVSSDAAAWGLAALGAQEIRVLATADGIVVLTASGVADW